jgi:hypothetical protein
MIASWRVDKEPTTRRVDATDTVMTRLRAASVEAIVSCLRRCFALSPVGSSSVCDESFG